MPVAFDFNEVPGPSAQEIKDHDGDGALCYGTGAQQSPEYIAGLERAGLHVAGIWEHNTDSILGDYAYGASECRAWEASHPPGLVYLACDLNDGALSGRDLTPVLHGWADNTREPAFGLYGSDDAIREGMGAGITRLQRWWGVVNWIRGGAPNNAQSNVDFWAALGVHLVQMIGSPIPNTDQNLILKPDWWTTTGGTQPKEQDPMKLIQDSRGIYVWEGLNFVSLSPPEVTAFQFLTGGPPTLIADAQVDTLMHVSQRLQSEGAVDPATLAKLLAPLLQVATTGGTALTAAQVESALRNVLHGA